MAEIKKTKQQENLEKTNEQLFKVQDLLLKGFQGALSIENFSEVSEATEFIKGLINKNCEKIAKLEEKAKDKADKGESNKESAITEYNKVMIPEVAKEVIKQLEKQANKQMVKAELLKYAEKENPTSKKDKYYSITIKFGDEDKNVNLNNTNIGKAINYLEEEGKVTIVRIKDSEGKYVDGVRLVQK